MQRPLPRMLFATLLVAASAVVALSAQESDVAEESGESTLTGCLSGVDGQWMVSGDEGTYPVVEGAASLEAHNGHRVRLTGQWQENADGEEAFVAETVEHLGVCDEE